jgi:AraC-like DNA-binding protein
MEMAYVHLYFSILFLANAIIQFVIFLLNKKPFHKWASITTLGCAYILFYLFMFHTGSLKQYPYLAGTSLYVQFTSFIPIFMMVCIITPAFRLSGIHYLLQLPALIAILRLFWLRLDSEFIEKIITETYKNNLPDYVPDQVINTLYGFHVVLVYTYLIYYYIMHLKWKNVWSDLKERGVVFKISMGIIGVNIFHFILYTGKIPFFSKFYPENVINFMNNIVAGEAFMYFLFFQLMPPLIHFNLSKTESIEGACQKFVRSRLDGIDLTELEFQIDKILSQEDVFLDENLNLDTFSGKTGYHSKIVSEYLNSIKKIRFNDLVNQHRITKAMELIKSDPEISITRAALNSGFNSLPTFYRIFKKQTGLSPEKYRRDTQAC